MIRDIRKLAKAVPFKTFNIRLSDGERIIVSDANSIAVAPEGDRIVVFTDDGEFHLVNVAQVTELVVS